MTHCLKLISCFVCLIIFSQAEETIIVNKNNVIHKFVSCDELTDRFIRYGFPGWERETFDVFEKNKNNRGIAIDIGAWIGTTAIWLAKNFYHVLAIEADVASLPCFKRNLIASECHNVTLCDKVISDKAGKVIFGPRGTNLNESISHLKKEINSEKDYLAEASTFKQILYDYLFSDEDLNSHEITFIKCDIEGGEETIIEDVLDFAYHNGCPVLMSFHLDWWNDKEITRFDNLFQFFTVNCPEQNVCKYIMKNPFTTILFTPIRSFGLERFTYP